MAKKHRIKPVPFATDFTKEEVKLLNHWYKSGLVTKYLSKNNKAKKRFSFFDGPITANNPMGVHHGWGRTYKDLWQRYYNMKGYAGRFQNGFDCQGLWVEVEVEKELGFKTKKDIEKFGIEKFVNQCKQRVLKYAKVQTEQSKRLGYFMDWDKSYFTMSDENNYMIWHFLKVCHQNGWLYKGKESVPWCPRCQTAISQHEMLTEDYKVVTHEAIYFALPIVSKKNEHLLVWTTTPWTLPANIAVAVDKDFDYALVKYKGQKYWLAKDAVKRVFVDKKHTIVKTTKGSKLIGLKYTGLFNDLPAVKKVKKQKGDKLHLVVATDQKIMPIVTDEGTGIVHTAVSAGTEDFKLGKKLGLPMIPVIADDASYFEGFGFLSHQNAKDNPRLILDHLLKNDKSTGSHWVFKIEKYKHRYPGCWRCKTELVWKVADEWYIAMDKGKPTLRQRMKKVAKQINWIPEFGLDREMDWLRNMHDWLISKKNRYWGLCLPIWECKACGHFEVIGSKEELKKRTVEGWKQFKGKSPHKPQMDKIKIKCRCGKLAERIEPVGNPWLDAGIIPFSTLVDPKTKRLSYTADKKYFNKWYPGNFITESFPGQFKNWFYSMIAMATVLEGKPSYKTVLGFGTLLGEDGRAMHKSWGNAIEFNEGAEKIGVDVMRWLYARQNPANNLFFGYKVAEEIKRKFHLLLWNSYRYFANYAALDKWQPSNKQNNLSILDKWILARFDQTVINVTNHLDNYTAYLAARDIEDFVTDFSTWYIRRSRDRVGPTAADQKDKQVCYQTMYQVLIALSKILAVFMPFMTELIYKNLTGKQSVHLESWPQPHKSKMSQTDKQLIADMQLVRLIVEKGHAERKLKQLKLRQPLQSITISGYNQKLSTACEKLIKDELNLKTIVWGKKTGDLTTKLDLKLTSKLKAEGKARELIREIQQARKVAGTRLDEKVIVSLPSWPKTFESEIKQKTLASKLEKGSSLHILRRSS